MRAQSKNIQTAEARENAGDQFAIGCGFSSDWLKRWHELSRPITSCNSFHCVLTDEFEVQASLGDKFITCLE